MIGGFSPGVSRGGSPPGGAIRPSGETAAKAILESRGNAPRLYRNTLVFLAADKSLPYATVVDVIDACRAAGVNTIGLVTKNAPKPAS